MKRPAALLAIAVLAVGCNPVHSHYSVKQTAPCLGKLGYRVDTNDSHLGVIPSAAPEGALRASEPGNTVTISFADNPAGARNIERGYLHHVPKRLRAHLNDVMESQHNAVLVWTVTPGSGELQRVLGCLK